MRRCLMMILIAVGLIAASVSSALAVVTPVAVKNSPTVREFNPAATSQFLAWVQNSAANPSHYNVFAQARAGGIPWRVNASGTSGYASSPIAGTENIIYQQAGTSNSDLYIYNLATKVRKKLPVKVDTALWEYEGVASSTYVAFMRVTSKARVLLLYKRSNGSVTQIATTTPGCGSCLSPSWVGANSLVYNTCSRTTQACNVKVYTVGGGTVTAPRNPAPYTNYGGSMDESTGNVYYISSTTWCGLFVSIDKWNKAGGPASSIYDFPEGIDGNSTSLAPDVTTPGDTDLLFSQYDCIADDSDIYEIDSVNLL
jgi:hypothetical protein